MRKLYMVTQVLAALFCGFIGVSAYAEDRVAGAMLICCAVWLAFKGDFPE